MNVILLIPLITSLLHSISSQSDTSSSNQKKSGHSATYAHVINLDPNNNNTRGILGPPPKNVAQLNTMGIIPQPSNNLEFYYKHLQEYSSRVPKELKEKLRKHNVPSNFRFSPYLSMAAALHRIESRQFAKFLAGMIRKGSKDTDDIPRDMLVDGRVKMEDLRKTAAEVKNHYENPHGSESQEGTVLLHHNLTFGETLSDLGISEYDAHGNLVDEIEPKTLFKLDKIGMFHEHLRQYKERVLNQMRGMLGKAKVNLKSFGLSPYLSMAAALYMDSKTFAKFLADNLVHKKITNADQIGDNVLVVEHVRMAHLREAARKIKEHYEGKGGAGPSSSGSRGGM